MASIRDLKKDINYELVEIIEAVYVIEAANNNHESKEGNKIIDNVFEIFEDLMAKVNNRDVENRKAHLKGVREELEKKGKALSDQLNKLG